ncbi:hypothetical protein NLJ89_g3829 [Agrocybe chaxingu]|uniref:Uncharacterized protein n=1 Tax=Agrocybe chaxingu TaxID=84603 RepID=A0A9W8K388_9AGAR|nr:hypothetical protein NLJ89_g3829 [Agrocybe chaxingu]
MGEPVLRIRASPPPLAQELLDAIVDELALPLGDCIPQHLSTATIVVTLKNCALVSRSFRRRSQRHLFHTIDITSLLFRPKGCYSRDNIRRQSPKAWKRLNEILQENPLLPTYIRQLGLWVDPTNLPWNRGDLGDVFSDIMAAIANAGKLRKLVLSSEGMERHFSAIGGLARLSEPIIARIWDPYIAPFVTSVELRCLAVPIDLFSQCIRLEEMKLESIDFMLDDPPTTGLTRPLRSLICSSSCTAIEQLLACAASPLGSLHLLELDTDTCTVVPRAFSIVATSKNSLEYLRFKTKEQYWWSLGFWRRVDSCGLEWPSQLPALRVLDADIVFNPPTRDRPDHSMKGVSTLLKSCGNRLEELKLTLYVSYHERMCPRMLVDRLDWKLVEAALCDLLDASTDRRLAVSITLAFCWNTVDREGTGMCVCEDRREKYSEEGEQQRELQENENSEQGEEEPENGRPAEENEEGSEEEDEVPVRFKKLETLPPRARYIERKSRPPATDEHRSDEELLAEGAQSRDGCARLCKLVLEQVVHEKFTRIRDRVHFDLCHYLHVVEVKKMYC